jgi:hypothetical protein
LDPVFVTRAKVKDRTTSPTLVVPPGTKGIAWIKGTPNRDVPSILAEAKTEIGDASAVATFEMVKFPSAVVVVLRGEDALKRNTETEAPVIG